MNSHTEESSLIMELECPYGSGKRRCRIEGSGDWHECLTCGGSGFRPTDIGKKILELMQRNFRPTCERMRMAMPRNRARACGAFRPSSACSSREALVFQPKPPFGQSRGTSQTDFGRPAFRAEVDPSRRLLPLRAPRFCLSCHFGGQVRFRFADQRLIRQPLVDHGNDGFQQSSQRRCLAIIEAQRFRVQIAKQMERLN